MIRRISEMGEVRVDVKLTNLVDAELARRGELSPDEVRTITRKAVVDSGAVMSMLPRDVVDDLDLGVSREAPVRLADGKSQQVGVAYGALFEILDRETEEQAYVLGNEILIGQTVLEKLDLLVDCANQQVIGNPEHPDGPLLRV